MQALAGFLVALSVAVSGASAQPLAGRIGNNDPSKYGRSRSHGSAGDMACLTLVDAAALNNNLLFVHRCQIMPGGGVGHHYHNQMEEMFVIFDNEAR
jgi:hypothetical protein